MSKSKQTPAPQQSPSLDDQAKEWHRLIDEHETSAAALYWQLGAVLEDIRQKHKFDWKSFLKHCKGLGLLRSRVTRALRIRKLHKDITQVDGKTLYEALEHGGKKKPVHCPQRVGSPVLDWERQAAVRYERALGGLHRALEVLRQVKSGAESADNSKPAEVVQPIKLIGGKKHQHQHSPEDARNVLRALRSKSRIARNLVDNAESDTTK